MGTPEDPNEILVFGYACKLFRDDDKAAWIEDEHHLIPWMGDPSVLIDRYDGRGHLMDLQGELDQCISDDSMIERELDAERYKDLRDEEYSEDHNSAQYQEDEFRRLQSDVDRSSYAAVAYSYDSENPPSNEMSVSQASKVEDDKDFVTPPGLTIPSGMVLPEKMRVHSIIEKTAKFIATQGTQMEIILKTKQAGNPLFSFLDYQDPLNPYFKYLIQAIRERVYVPSDEYSAAGDTSGKQLQEQESNESEEDEDGGYLHPSLFGGGSSLQTSNILKSVQPSGPTAYSLLVSKIKGSSGNNSAIPPQDNTSVPGNGYSYGFAFPGAGGYWQSEHQMPGNNDQVVIEKMATYVIKNGLAFEELAKTKGDPRFVFLNPTHPFHWYYQRCKEKYMAESSAVVASNSFVSYSNPPPLPAEPPKSETTEAPKELSTKENKVPLQSVQLPLSADGIPIANLESISSRPSSIPPEVASRIELLKKKNSLFSQSSKSQNKIQFSSSIGKGMNLGAAVESTANHEDSTKPEVVECEEVKDEICTEPSPEEPAEFEEKCHDDKPTVVADKETQQQIRRQKAALFLQKLKASNEIQFKPEITSVEQIPLEKDLPVKSPPDPEIILRQTLDSVDPEIENSTPTTTNYKINPSPSHKRSRSASSSGSRECLSDASRGRKKHSKHKSFKKRKKKKSRHYDRSQSRSRSASRSPVRIPRKSKKHKRYKDR